MEPISVTPIFSNSSLRVLLAPAPLLSLLNVIIMPLLVSPVWFWFDGFVAAVSLSFVEWPSSGRFSACNSFTYELCEEARPVDSRW